MNIIVVSPVTKRYFRCIEFRKHVLHLVLHFLLNVIYVTRQFERYIKLQIYNYYTNIFFCYTWRAIFRPFFVILVKFSKVLLYLHLVILRPFLIFLLYLFGYTWPLVKIFVIPGFVIPLNKYNKKNTHKRWFTDFSKI